MATLVVMAAGLGSRYGGSKQLEGVGPAGELLLEYAAFDARRSGFTRAVFILRRDLEEPFAPLAERMAKFIEVDTVIQDPADLPSWLTPPARTRPWGTVHAVLAARRAVDGPFGVLNADDFYGAAAFDLARAACESAARDGAYATIGLPLEATLSPHGPVVRGICETRGEWLTRLEEVRQIERTADGVRGEFRSGPRTLTGREIASMNFWVFTPEVFTRLAIGSTPSCASPGATRRRNCCCQTPSASSSLQTPHVSACTRRRGRGSDSRISTIGGRSRRAWLNSSAPACIRSRSGARGDRPPPAAFRGLHRPLFVDARNLDARPGRVELLGSHTDYNLGRVLTLPIDRDTWCATAPRADRIVRVFSRHAGETDQFSLDDPQDGTGWARYARGVAAVLREEDLAVTGCDVAIDSMVPIGAGLSSSASLECALATMWQALGGWRIDPARLARLCQRAENERVGVACGILDQYSAMIDGAGGALLLDCRDLSSRPVPISPAMTVVICDTRVSRELAASPYAARRAECEAAARELGVASLRELTVTGFAARTAGMDHTLANRARFIVEEDARVPAFAGALGQGDAAAVRRLTAESFDGARDLFDIVNAPMLAMRNAARASPGIIGVRQSGAGFGGCLVAVVERGRERAFADRTTRAYREATGVEPGIFEVRPAPPAGEIR